MPKIHLSSCCNAPYLWLTCDKCELDEDAHDFATCSECGKDIYAKD